MDQIHASNHKGECALPVYDKLFSNCLLQFNLGAEEERTAAHLAQRKQSFNTQTHYLKHSVPTSEAHTLASETNDLFNFCFMLCSLSA